MQIIVNTANKNLELIISLNEYES